MLRASALYIVIIIALVIAVLCSSLIVTAYYYRSEYQKKFRYDRLQSNIISGESILLASDAVTYNKEKEFGLFGNADDSVSLKRIPWGIYDVAMCRAFIQKDSLQKVFTIASQLDSTKWAALYLIDEDRPLSVSGKTMIQGNVFIPKAGVKEAYVDGKAYQGDKRLVIGAIHDSQKVLPALNDARLNLINSIHSVETTDTTFNHRDSLTNSFFKKTIVVNFKKKVTTLANIKISGNIIILSDTTLVIDKTATLKNVIISARSISIAKEFTGCGQFFATDSIGVQSDCNFSYPSVLAVLRFKTDKSVQGRIHLGQNTVVNGAVFTYEKEASQLKTLLDLDKNVKIRGQVYVQGLIKLKDGDQFDGSVFVDRFLYQSAYTSFENYLINARLNMKALSPYYLSSSLFSVNGKTQKILQWLESN